jgi:hypothetical protein
MIEKIETIESFMDTLPCQLLIDGLRSIDLCITISKTGNEELIKAFNNGRRK